MQQRAALMALQSQCDQAQQQLRQWQALHPGLPERQALQQRLAQQVERNQQLQRELNLLASRTPA
ncbi:hypothetical protein Q6294_32850, partial [Klebsiella pneumoniae]